MFKILYAAGNNTNALVQLNRFIKALKIKNITLKIAAYKKSSPIGDNIDWTLNSLLTIFNNKINLNNSNCQIYLEQVKNFNPDLIISDFEIYTSYIGNILNIPVWQCSPLLLAHGVVIKDTNNSGMNKNFRYLLVYEIQSNTISNIIKNSDKKYIYSYFGDLNISPTLKNSFEWIRPYHDLGKISIPCKHKLMSSMIESNTKMISIMNNYNDCIMYSELDKNHNIIQKSFHSREEYFCNLKNCELFLCEGQMSFLSDAFYNNKYSIVTPNFNDPECVLSSVLSQHVGYSKNIFNDENINNYFNKEVSYRLNNKIKYLHEKIEEYIGES